VGICHVVIGARQHSQSVSLLVCRPQLSSTGCVVQLVVSAAL